MAINEKTSTGSSDENQSRNSQGSGPLFYAYARRTDSHWASRYLLTFASAAIANEWWSLVQKEYPDAGVRTHPQLFSFQGDALPRKTANNKKFDHLTTKWFYSQIGDSDRTDGRMQDIIPAQDGEGNILFGGDANGGGGGGARGGVDHAGVEVMEQMMRKMQELMEGNASQIKTLSEMRVKNNERSEIMNSIIEKDSAHIKTLQARNEEQAERLNKMVQENATHIKTLAETQSQHNERSERIEKLVAENATQIKLLAESQSKTNNNFKPLEHLIAETTHQIRSLSDRDSTALSQHQTNHLKHLAESHSTTTKSLQSTLEQTTKASNELTKELKRHRQQKTQVSFEDSAPRAGRAECVHDVRPPPRKIDRKIVGYEYGQRKVGGGGMGRGAGGGK